MQYRRWYGAALAAVGGLVLASVASADPQVEQLKDRNPLPKQKHQVVEGKAIGLLVSNVAPVMGQEGRGGPPDAMGFAMGLNSYRWVYVPTPERPLITNLSVPVKNGPNQV